MRIEMQSFLVINNTDWQTLRNSLRVLARGFPSADLVVVHHGSEAKTIAECRAEFPTFKLIETAPNRTLGWLISVGCRLSGNNDPLVMIASDSLPLRPVYKEAGIWLPLSL